MVLASTRIVPSSSSCGPRVHPRMWSSRPPAYVVLASTRVCGSRVHPRMWFSRPPAYLASTRVCGPRVHPHMWFSRPPVYVVLASTRVCGSRVHPLRILLPDAVLRQCFQRWILRCEAQSLRRCQRSTSAKPHERRLPVDTATDRLSASRRGRIWAVAGKARRSPIEPELERAPCADPLLPARSFSRTSRAFRPAMNVPPFSHW